MIAVNQTFGVPPAVRFPVITSSAPTTTESPMDAPVAAKESPDGRASGRERTPDGPDLTPDGRGGVISLDSSRGPIHPDAPSTNEAGWIRIR
jgi:hypothetical protein